MEARLRMDDADVGERRLSENQRDITSCELPLEAVEIIELDDAGRHRRIDRRAEIAAARTNDSVVAERREGLVDGAVIAPIENEDG